MATERELPLHAAFARHLTFDQLKAICPHCGALAVFQDIGGVSLGQIPVELAGDRVGAILCGRCPGCYAPVVGLRFDFHQGSQARLVWPTSVPADRSPAGLEPEFRSVYDQARSVLSLSPIASAVLARRCLQHVIRGTLGITKGRLFDEIEAAVKKNEVSKPTRDALDHIRTIGNWGAHPVEDQASTIIDVTPEEAEYTLQVLELVFHDLFTVPQRTSAMDAKLKAKK